MQFFAVLTFVCFLTLIVHDSDALSQERDRTKIPEKYTWKLTDIYPSDEAFRADKEKLQASISSLAAYKGTLGKSAAQLRTGLDLMFSLVKQYNRLSVYASLYSDQDTRDSKYLGMTQEMGQIGTTLDGATAFVEPEILKMSAASIEEFLTKEPGLVIYRFYLNDILRRQAHTGTEGEEKIIADAGLMSSAPSDVFGIFTDADFPYPDVTLSDGKTVHLDKAAFNFNRASANRADRKKVFDTFFGRMYEYRRTLGTDLYGEVKKDMFYAQARKYGSSVESALDAANIPVQVYHSLIENVNKNLGTFHRYLKLRRRILGVDTLHYYDLYAPLIASVQLKYTVEESRKNILDAVKPLGEKYAAVVQKALDERWIDMYPTSGKRAGAYSQGSVYDVHPYMLLNYNGKYDDMSTLAHELGHTMQSYLSNTAQPYPTARYPIFVAEVASTFNEALLIDHMLKTISDDAARLSLLGNYLEGIKGTVFRQTQFAEFELAIHERAEKGEALTGDKLNEIYAGITKKYYGHDAGVCIVDSVIQSEWSFVPHFYYNFYLYQYATSFTASAALSEQVLSGNKEATGKYLEFLSAGGSDYPINLLKKAGVDMTTSLPLELTMKKMNRVIDEMEQILTKMGK